MRQAGAGTQISTSGGAVFQETVSVDGDFVNRDKITYIYHIYQSAPGPAHLNEAEFQRVLLDYLGWVQKAYARARLYGLESMRTARGRPVNELTEVFVPLSLRRFAPPARRQIEEMARRFKGDPLAEHRAFVALVDEQKENGDAISLDNLLLENPRLAVIGSAGCGKSTLSAYLAYCLARHAQGQAALPFKLPATQTALVPVLIPLRYYRQYQDACNSAPDQMAVHPRLGTLAGFLLWYLHRRSPALELSQDFFDRLLLGGGCLVILDGLDEIVDQTERGHMRTQVERLANDVYADNHFIVTAREAGYRENAVFNDDFVRLDVQRLNDAEIRALVQNWCTLLYAADAQTQTDEIVDAIQTINARYQRQNLPPLVTTPLMTTMVISVKWGETELPRERAKLYEAAVRVVLQAQHLDDDPTRHALINSGGDWEDQLLWLSHLALAMHSQGERGAAVDETGVRALLPKSMTEEQVDTFVRAVRLRGGLFEERGELFQFLHLTFQEFLAARLLAKDRQKSWPILRKHITDAWWREVFLLHYGFAKTDHPPYAQEFLDWLSDLPDADDATRLAALELAATAVLEIERPDPELRRLQAERFTAFLFDPVRQNTPVQRSAAGVTLGKLGDPRRGVGLRSDGLPDIDWVPIDAGPFTMGSDKRVDPDAYDNETPQFTCRLITQPYRMARYPVTVTQYACFVRAGGYHERRFWTDAGWSWRVKKEIEGPDEYSERFQTPNHPQVGVSWYEAVAYCNWLSEALNTEIRLPSEAEWERAARHTDGRIYPWGGEFAPERCNMSGTGIGATSAVGLFLNGAAESGVMDMSGNAWEWCSTQWRENYRDYEANVDNSLDVDARRVLRGGSFNRYRRDVRSAYRHWYVPAARALYYGFRVVSPGL